jgi:hypothetical protein
MDTIASKRFNFGSLPTVDKINRTWLIMAITHSKGAKPNFTWMKGSFEYSHFLAFRRRVMSNSFMVHSLVLFSREVELLAAISPHFGPNPQILVWSSRDSQLRKSTLSLGFCVQYFRLSCSNLLRTEFLCHFAIFCHWSSIKKLTFRLPCLCCQ